MSGKKQAKNGKPASTSIGLVLASDVKNPTSELRRVLKTVYNHFRKIDDPAKNAIAREDFVFHMTDWIDDLEDLAALYACPAQTNKAAANEVVFGFLIHALPHLMEAGRLLEGKEIRNPFLSLSDRK